MTKPPDTPTDPIRRYHERTKHRFDGYAAGPGGLDWDDQPDPFRGYGDCPRCELGWVRNGPGFAALAAGELPPPASLDRRSLGVLLACSLAIATWKRYGPDRWALRCNPSSGNLHPTEAYAVLPSCDGLDAGLYHYRPRDHRLEQRCAHPEALTGELFGELPEGGFLLGLSAIPWREAWKYGERAWRYCLLDLGHALGALRYAAAVLGWSVTSLEHLADGDLAALLGLDRRDDFAADEPEYPELLCLIAPADRVPAQPWRLPGTLAGRLQRLPWRGRANRLSPRHDHHWSIIDESIRAAGKPATPPPVATAAALPPPLPFDSGRSAVELIRGRRSAQTMDGKTALGRDGFLALLDHCLPRNGLPPWGPQPASAAVHLVLFVHRVEDLSPGLYALPRRPDSLPDLKSALRAEFRWQPVADCPAHLPLYRLVTADTRRSAVRLACRQPIAGGGAFSVAMLGEFETGLGPGPWGYRSLMAEAGLVGQALYLGAEACGLQGTGIGCFFDDGLHELLGLRDRRYQVLYQFTVGKGRPDTRISNEPAYPMTGFPA